MPNRAAVVFGAFVVAGLAAFVSFGVDDLVRCRPGSWRNEYGCVAPCPPGTGRIMPGSTDCLSREPVATPTP